MLFVIQPVKLTRVLYDVNMVPTFCFISLVKWFMLDRFLCLMAFELKRNELMIGCHYHMMRMNMLLLENCYNCPAMLNLIQDLDPILKHV
jgi:hypothetical protein